LLCRNTEKGESAAKSIKDQITSEIHLQNHGTRRSGFKVLHNVEDGGENNNHKPDVHVYRLDLGSTSCIRECARNITKNETKIDILINNAGKCIKYIKSQ
jgi:NAD(P)-dependent dehydrogenase (short-subunit alcohol dehydrogenase family)